MDEIWVVRDASPGELIEWMGTLVAAARGEQGLLPFRSQAPMSDAVAVDPALLPLPSRSRVVAAGAIYTRKPAHYLPFGELLALLLVEPDRRPEQQTSARPLLAEIATDPRFALVGDEVAWLFTLRFPQAQRRKQPRRSGTLRAINRLAAVPGSGAPVLACNLWLEEQLLALESPSQRNSLYKPWLERYVALRGAPPVEPKRSFRAAVASCERRFRRRGLRTLRDWHDDSARASGLEPDSG